MATSINCVIVEDEPLAQERIRDFIAKIPYLDLHATFDNGIDALVYLKTHTVDLVFLDINMGDFSGIQLLQTAGITGQVILITAYDQYALQGYELAVTDYLLKPYTFDRFFTAVEKARAQLTRNTPATRNFFFVKTEYRLEKFLFSEVFYIEGMRDYRKIVAADRQVLTLQTFREFEQEIPPAIICRVHKSYMVALDKIDAIERDTILIKDTMIPVSETYKKQFYNLIVRST
jgi:DNA-binding LytR/AlgR family response regulator